MVRLGIILWPLGIVLVAMGLFQIKYSVEDIDDEIRHVENKIDALRDYENVLTAEWEYRTQPAILEELANRHLGLKGDQGTIVTSLERLPYRVPSDSVTAIDLPWNSNIRSERLDETPDPQLTGVQEDAAARQVELDELQSLISEIEGM